MSTAIKFENISKQYRLGLVSTQTLSHDLNRWWQTSIRGKEDPYLKIGEVNDRAHKGESDYVWALRDIDFEVQQGDVLGIIGKNGAGKSTLLKILSKVTAPTTGTIKAAGRIASLLEVGTGFHPEMTGRENIFMNGAIMGMSKAEIKRKLDEIVDFSGVERYLDTPVKRYSSGMTVRLGFAIAAHLDPEILVVDEVLAVGDAEFQKKAIGKMQDVSKGEGRTVLFVSHNMASIQRLCTKGLVLQDGQIIKEGKINECVNTYLEYNKWNSQKITDSISFCHHGIKIESIKVNGRESNKIDVTHENKLHFSFRGSLLEDSRVSMEVRLFDTRDIPLAFFSPGHKTGLIPTIPKGKFNLEYDLILPSNMNKGTYIADIYLTYPGQQSWISISKGLFIETDGTVETGGAIFEYDNGAGWLFI